MEVDITQILRPLRLLLLIRPSNKKSFQRAVNLCSAYFGGKYFPIVPFYEKFPPKYRDDQQLYVFPPLKFYNQIIDNYNVDFVVYDNSLKVEKIKKYIPGKELIPISNIENSLCSDEPKYGFGLHQLLPQIREKEFKYVRTDNKKLLFTQTDKTDLIWQVVFGNISGLFSKYLINQNIYSDTDIIDIDTDNALSHLNNDYINYLDMGSHGVLANGVERDAIYFLPENDLTAVNNFWNLRALGWNIIPVPWNFVITPELNNILKPLLLKYHEDKFWRLSILGKMQNEHLPTERFQSLLYMLNNDTTSGYTFQWWVPRYWEDNIYKRYDRAFAATISVKSKTMKLQIADAIYFPVLKPDFMHEYYHSHIDPVYTNSVLVRVKTNIPEYVEIFPRVLDKDVPHLIRSILNSSISTNGLNFYPHLHEHHIHFYLPLGETILEHLFESHKLKIKVSSAGKLTREVLKNLGSIYGANILSNEPIIDLLLMFENGKVVGKKAIFDFLQRHRNKFVVKKDPSQNLELLIDRKFIRLGAQIDCQYCNRNSFYMVNELDYTIKCKICQNTFSLPTHNPNAISWAYQGVGPFALNNRAEGIIAVLLTLRFFKISFRLSNATTAILSTDIYKDNERINEIDLTLFQENQLSASNYPDLIFCECKSYNDLDEVDITKMAKLAKLFPGCILLFATLKKQLNPKEKRLIKRLANSFRVGNNFRPLNHIMILTGNELISSNPFEALKKLEQHKIQTYHNDDSLGHFCDMTNLEYLALKPYRTIVEERYQKRWAKIEARKGLFPETH